MAEDFADIDAHSLQENGSERRFPSPSTQDVGASSMGTASGLIPPDDLASSRRSMSVMRRSVGSPPVPAAHHRRHAYPTFHRPHRCFAEARSAPSRFRARSAAWIAIYPILTSCVEVYQQRDQDNPRLSAHPSSAPTIDSARCRLRAHRRQEFLGSVSRRNRLANRSAGGQTRFVHAVVAGDRRGPDG